MTEAPLDWTKPIQFANGKPAVLVCTTATNCKGRPYAVLRPNEKISYCAIWRWSEDED